MSAITVSADPTTTAFPASREEFYRNKPDNMSDYAWVFCHLNPLHLPMIAVKLLAKIRFYGRRFNNGFTFFFQRTIAKWLGISEQWLRELLGRLKTIGMIEDRRVRKARQYRIIEAAFAPAPEATRGDSCGDNESEDPVNAGNSNRTSEPPPLYSGNRNHDLTSKVSIIKPDDREANLILAAMREADIRYRPERDTLLLKTLCAKFDPTCIITGILMSVARCNGKVNSLKYCVNAIEEVANVASGKLRQPDGQARPFISADYLAYVRRKVNQLCHRE